MKIDIEQPGSDTWFFPYPKAIFFCTESSHDLSLTSAHFILTNHFFGESLFFDYRDALFEG